MQFPTTKENDLDDDRVAVRIPAQGLSLSLFSLFTSDLLRIPASHGPAGLCS